MNLIVLAITSDGIMPVNLQSVSIDKLSLAFDTVTIPIGIA